MTECAGDIGLDQCLDRPARCRMVLDRRDLRGDCVDYAPFTAAGVINE